MGMEADSEFPYKYAGALAVVHIPSTSIPLVPHDHTWLQAAFSSYVAMCVVKGFFFFFFNRKILGFNKLWWVTFQLGEFLKN